MGRHRHEFVELVVVLSGEAVHVAGKVRQRVRGGDILVIPRSASHGYEETRGLNLINVLIRHDWMPRLVRDLRQLPGYHSLFPRRTPEGKPLSLVHLTSRDLESVRTWIDLLEEEAKRNSPDGWLLAEAYLTLILGLICRQGSKSSGSSPLTPSARIGRALSWLEQHVADRPSVAELARAAGMSERSFHRHFHATTGQSPHRYLLRSRLNVARGLLESDGALQVSEVAAAAGFRDGNELARTFQRELGRTPSEMRQKPRS